MVFRDSGLCFKLAAEVCSQRAGSKLTLAWKGESSGCGTASVVSEGCQLRAAGSPDVLPPEPAGWQSKEGGASHGGRD